MATIADKHPSRDLGHVNLRAFLAGGTATTALIAAAVLVFVSLAAYVAFSGIPAIGNGAGGDQQVLIEPGAPEAAAAGRPAAPAAGATRPAARGALGAPAGTASGGAPGGGAQTSATSAGDGLETAAPTIPGGGGEIAATPPRGETGPLGGAIGGLPHTAAGLGLPSAVGDAGGEVAAPLDEVVGGAVADVGGSIGEPDLGGQAGSGVNGAD